MCPLSLLLNCDWRNFPWFPPYTDFTASLSDRHPKLTGISTSGGKKQESNPEHLPPAWQAQGSRQPLPDTCPGQAGTRAWHHHSKSKGCANLKRLGTPGLKCIRYHTAHPERISPSHHPATLDCGGGGEPSSYAGTHRKYTESRWQSVSPGSRCQVWP